MPDKSTLSFNCACIVFPDISFKNANLFTLNVSDDIDIFESEFSIKFELNDASPLNIVVVLNFFLPVIVSSPAL